MLKISHVIADGKMKFVVAIFLLFKFCFCLNGFYIFFPAPFGFSSPSPASLKKIKKKGYACMIIFYQLVSDAEGKPLKKKKEAKPQPLRFYINT